MNAKIRIVCVLWYHALVNYLDRVAISFAGPAIIASLGLSPAEFGIVLSSFGVGYMLALVPGGMIVDRIGVRLALIIGPLLWAFFVGITGFVTTLLTFVIVRVLFGMSEGAFTSGLYKAVGDNFEPKQRSGVLAICLSALALAPAIAGPLVGLLVSRVGWQMMFALLVIPSLLASAVSYLLIPRNEAHLEQSSAPEKDATPGKTPLRFREVLKRPSLWLLSLANMASDIAQWGFLGWMPTYLAMERNIELQHSSSLGGIAFVFAFFGLLVGGWLGSTTLFHRRRGHLAVVGYLAAAVSLFFAYNADTLTSAVVGLSITAFFLYGSAVPKGATAIDLSPKEHRGAYVGTYSMAGQLGGASAPAIIGLLVTTSGNFATGFAFMIIALGTAALCMAALIPMLARDRGGATNAPAPAAAGV